MKSGNDDREPLRREKVMIIFAHPDDAEGNCGENHGQVGQKKERGSNIFSSPMEIRGVGIWP